MESAIGEIIYQGNSIISVESLPDYPHPVIVKRPAKPHASRRNIQALEKEYEMARSLDTVEGVRQSIEKLSIENQPVLILEYIDGQTLQDLIRSETLNLRSRLRITVELACILARIHQQNGRLPGCSAIYLGNSSSRRPSSIHAWRNSPALIPRCAPGM